MVAGSDDLHLTPAETSAETREGRMLSDSNLHKMRSAMSELQAIMLAAGSTPEETQKALKDLGDKCGCYCDEDGEWKPYGGATSFAEVDAFKSGQNKQNAIEDLNYQFEALVKNIWADEAMDVVAKAQAIARAAGELEGRVGTAASKSRGGWLDKVKSVLGVTPRADQSAMLGAADWQPNPETDRSAVSSPVPMAVFKDEAGSWRYVAVATNAFTDKERERFTATAHREYVAWVDAEKEYPQLWLWHTPGTRIGQADCIYFDEDTGFRVSTGTFDKGMDDVAERLAGMSGLAMSHGFLFRTDELVNGEYHRYRSFEETLLPSIDVAANDGTAFIAAREEDMTVPAVKREFFEQALGKDRFAKIEASLSGKAGEMSDADLGAALKAALNEAPPPPAVSTVGSPEVAATTGGEVGAVGAGGGTDAPAADDEKALAATIVSSVKDALPAIVASGIKDALAPVNAAVAGIVEWQKGVDATLATLKQGDDEKIVNLFGMRGLTMTPPTADAPLDGRTAEAKLLEATRKVMGDTEPTNDPVKPMVDMLLADLGARQPVGAS